MRVVVLGSCLQFLCARPHSVTAESNSAFTIPYVLICKDTKLSHRILIYPYKEKTLHYRIATPVERIELEARLYNSSVRAMS